MIGLRAACLLIEHQDGRVQIQSHLPSIDVVWSRTGNIEPCGFQAIIHRSLSRHDLCNVEILARGLTEGSDTG